ncbi:MAG: tetratricopeptide repeat protein [bacterium]|nr:tetratricopeptide repeat protein [bacterium]
MDTVSNHVVDLIHAGRLDEAEAAARDLMQRFPEAIDGLERLGHVYEARGDFKRAAQYYRQAVAHIGGPDADEHTRWLQDLAEKLDPDTLPQSDK